MNKFAKALIVSLFFAAPVAISANVVQAKTVSSQPQQIAQATTQKPAAKKHRVKHSVRRHAKRAAAAARSTVKK